MYATNALINWRPFLLVWLVLGVGLALLGGSGRPTHAAPLAQGAAFDCTSVTEIALVECQALVAFYHSTGGSNWVDNSNWLQTTTPCNSYTTANPAAWSGVKCIAGTVTSLALPANQLDGVLSPQLGNFPHLSFIDLSENRLRGPIPAELGNLIELGFLALDNNQLSGPLPATLGNLSNLTFLSLEANFLSGPLPLELGNLTQLTGLWLKQNRFTGNIPPPIGNLTLLTHLDLSNNQLQGPLPSGLGNLTLLQLLDLSNNQLQGVLPPGLGNLSKVTSFYVNGNQLSGPILPELGKLTRVEALDLGNNRFTGEIPPQLGQLVNLQRLWLNNSQLRGPIPPELGNLPFLNWLNASGNGLSGVIPPALANAASLTSLYLNDNQLSGAIPLQLGSLPNLQVLLLSSNQLSGSIPAELGQLTHLTTLGLNGNQLSGPLPPELVNLTNLTALSVGDNQLSGPIPAALGQLTNLDFLSLRGNQFSGVVPPELGGLVNLTSLFLHDNQLYGPLPLALVNLGKLVELDIDYNGFTAPLPTLHEFLDAKAPGWAATQTVPPSAAAAHIQANNAIALTWTPIAYTLDGGYYEISYATTPEGPYTVHGHTLNKQSRAYTVDRLTPQTTYYLRLRTLTPSHHSQHNDQWSAYSEIATITTPAASQGDAYESNDDCAAARTLVADGRRLEQSFHRPGDVDWLQFAAQSGVTYRIDVQIPAGSPADVNLKLYNNCAGAQIDQQNQPFSAGIQLVFTPPQAGPIYLELANSDAQVGGPQVAYQLTVRALGSETASGAVIIVAGRLRQNDPLQPNIHNVTAAVHQLFLAHGYTEENIHYLASDPNLAGVDGPATAPNLRDAIVSWSVSRVTNERALTLYLIDHGEPGFFYLDGANRERLTPAELNRWLTQLEETVPGVPINVIIEACNAGSFITATGGISKPGRVILTSTSANFVAFASAKGAHFSDHLLTAMRQGQHLFGSFWEARVALLNSHAGWQEPWLDADGNGKPNELDDALYASLRGFAYGGTLTVGDSLWPPTIVATQAEDDRLRALVRDDKGVQRVWAVIYAPSYIPPQNSHELVPETPASAPGMTIVQLQAQGDDSYSAVFNDFGESGVYRVVFYAEDGDGLKARPIATTKIAGQTLTNHRFFLPVVVGGR